MRNHFLYVLLFLAGLAGLSSCSDYETYGEKKEKAYEAIQSFISDSSINVINEAQFHAQHDSTYVYKGGQYLNQYVYLNNTGVYMQIVRKGCGTPLEESKTGVNILCRYTEYNILDKVVASRDDQSARNYEKMHVTRTGTTYDAYFASGVMSSTYSTTTVPSGWLVPLAYINIGRPVELDDEIALVKLIVPHTQGTSDASSNVYPCHYVISYQREQ